MALRLVEFGGFLQSWARSPVHVQDGATCLTSGYQGMVELKKTKLLYWRFFRDCYDLGFGIFWVLVLND